MAKTFATLSGLGSAGQALLKRKSGASGPAMGTILAVDDEATAREAIYEVLSREGYAVYTASSYQGWEEACASGLSPDLVILDVILTERRGGYEILRALRKQDRSIPVLMLSARNTAADAAFAVANGASAFVSKGDGEFDHPSRGLVATVRRLLA